MKLTARIMMGEDGPLYEGRVTVTVAGNARAEAAKRTMVERAERCIANGFSFGVLWGMGNNDC